MSDIDRAIAFCASFDPALPSQLKGATPEQIAEIEFLLQRPPGTMHREFLERLGGSPGWLIDFFDTSAAGLLRAHARTSGELPPGIDLFGVASDEPLEDLYLVEEEGRDGPLIYAIPTLRTGHYGRLPALQRELAAGSLPEYLCRTALERYRFTDAPFDSFFSQKNDPASLHAAFDAVLTAAGFSVAWFSDSMTRVALADGLAAMATQRPGEQMYVRVGGPDAELFAKVSERLIRDLDLQVVP